MTARLHLYQALSRCKTEEDLSVFAADLLDRFGTIPKPTLDLLDSVRLQRLAQSLGFEKISLKSNRLVAQLISEPHFVQGAGFGKILAFLQTKAAYKTELQDKDGKIRLLMPEIKTVQEALDKLGRI
jgi:transcription-repair coupling factor (superfamily II helicase)